MDSPPGRRNPEGILLATVPLTAVLLVLMVDLAAVFFPILSRWLSTLSGMRMYSGISREYDSICYLDSKYESGGNPDDAGGDEGRACGELQFDCEYGLGPLVSWCYEQDPVFYAPFAPFLGMTMELLGNQEFFLPGTRSAHGTRPGLNMTSLIMSFPGRKTA